MKAAYYFRRAMHVASTRGVGEVFRLGLRLARFHVQRQSGLLRAAQMRRELKRIPTNLTVDEVWDVACRVGDGLIAPMQHKGEFVSLLQKVFVPGAVSRVLEIGTCGGGSLFCFCRLAADDAVVISVDLPGGFFGGGSPWWKVPVFECFSKAGQKLHLLRCDSHAGESLKRVESLLGGDRLDFLLIDGDHTYDGVRMDFEMYAPLVREGGFIAFHDIVPGVANGGDAGVRRVEVGRYWNEIKDSYRHWSFTQSGAIGIGLIEKCGHTLEHGA